MVHQHDMKIRFLRLWNFLCDWSRDEGRLSGRGKVSLCSFPSGRAAWILKEERATWTNCSPAANDNLDSKPQAQLCHNIYYSSLFSCLVFRQSLHFLVQGWGNSNPFAPRRLSKFSKYDIAWHNCRLQFKTVQLISYNLDKNTTKM